MNSDYSINKSSWETILSNLVKDYLVLAPFPYGEHLEYDKLTAETAGEIVYNHPKPSSPLKTFFLPVRENVLSPGNTDKKRIIIGCPACDLAGLSILDEIYLNQDYTDPVYARNRENTLLIGTDCHTINEHCHCTTYGFNPWPEENADIILTEIDDNIVLSIISEKGQNFKEQHLHTLEEIKNTADLKISELRNDTLKKLKEKDPDLPDYIETGTLITHSTENIWKKYSETCVSCGACSAICPTCSCFLFIERPEFEKVRSIDTCQYPGFERVAAGEDPLRPLEKRFRNRYMCKYVWKPLKFKSKACTGCGRCIEACIGDINKNDLFRELKQNLTVEA